MVDDADAKEANFLPTQPGRMQAVREDDLKRAGEESFPRMPAADAKMGDLLYAVYELSDPVDKAKPPENWGYLGKVIEASATQLRLHLADAHEVVGTRKEDENPSVDLYLTDPNLPRLYTVARGRDLPAVRAGGLHAPTPTAQEIEDELSKDKSVGRFKPVDGPERRSMLSA